MKLKKWGVSASGNWWFDCPGIQNVAKHLQLIWSSWCIGTKFLEELKWLDLNYGTRTVVRVASRATYPILMSTMSRVYVIENFLFIGLFVSQCCTLSLMDVWYPFTYRFHELCGDPMRKIRIARSPLRLKGGQLVTLGVQSGTQDVQTSLWVMVDACIWTCSEQSHKGRRGGWLLKGCSNEAHRRVWRMNAQWSANGRHVINAFWSKPDPPIWVSPLPPLYIHCASIGQPIAWIGRRHGHRSAFIWRPRQPLSHHGNCSSLHLP